MCIAFAIHSFPNTNWNFVVVTNPSLLDFFSCLNHENSHNATTSNVCFNYWNRNTQIIFPFQISLIKHEQYKRNKCHRKMSLGNLVVTNQLKSTVFSNVQVESTGFFFGKIKLPWMQLWRRSVYFSVHQFYQNRFMLHLVYLSFITKMFPNQPV